MAELTKAQQRIQDLLLWAETHSPRTKELHRLITSYIQASEQDRVSLTQTAATFQHDRNSMATIARKLYARWAGLGDAFDKYVNGGVSEQGAYEPMTDEEYRLYAAATINQCVAEQKVMLLNTDQGRDRLIAISEDAFAQVKALGCSDEVVEDMRKHFRGTLVVEPQEDAKLQAALEEVK